MLIQHSALMDQFGWSTIGLVYDGGSAFHLETAQYFSRQVVKNLITKLSHLILH